MLNSSGRVCSNGQWKDCKKHYSIMAWMSHKSQERVLFLYKYGNVVSPCLIYFGHFHIITENLSCASFRVKEYNFVLFKW